MPDSLEARRRRRAENIAYASRVTEALKLTTGCIDCGYRKHPAALHFDHRDPSTKRRELGWYEDRSRLASRAALTRFLVHVEKYCDVRCANCHAERTMAEQHWRPRAVSQSEPGLF